MEHYREAPSAIAKLASAIFVDFLVILTSEGMLRYALATIKDVTCKNFNEIKACTMACTGCGGCVLLVTSIFNKTMTDMGQEVKNVSCSHFAYSRADLFNIVMVKKLESLEAIMKEYGEPESLGCELCKPVVVSILSSLFSLQQTCH